MTGQMEMVENNAKSTRLGGATGAGFKPGVSGNPGGRPKGLARRVRELVGDDGQAIADFMVSVMADPRARTKDRLDAGRWLADRAFGKAVQPLDLDVAADGVPRYRHAGLVRLPGRLTPGALHSTDPFG